MGATLSQNRCSLAMNSALVSTRTSAGSGAWSVAAEPLRGRRPAGSARRRRRSCGRRPDEAARARGRYASMFRSLMTSVPLFWKSVPSSNVPAIAEPLARQLGDLALAKRRRSRRLRERVGHRGVRAAQTSRRAGPRRGRARRPRGGRPTTRMRRASPSRGFRQIDRRRRRRPGSPPHDLGERPRLVDPAAAGTNGTESM